MLADRPWQGSALVEGSAPGSRPKGGQRDAMCGGFYLR
jgi:hypothetical protein